MSNFADVMRTKANETLTENGAVAYRSTNGGALLDLYAKAGSLRRWSAEDIISDWKAARKDNEELADNLILYIRDIRNAGLGERRVGRILLKELARLNPAKVQRNFDTIVSAGRWDDLFELFGTALEESVIKFIVSQIVKDLESMAANQPISLLAKWMPSINTSSAETRARARKICKTVGTSERNYRKMLSKLRGYLKVLEKKMSAQEWNTIEYSTIPAIAARRYQDAFVKNDGERYQAYLDALEKGETKVNAATLYPYEIVRPYVTYSGNTNPVLDEAQWKKLPNYVNGEYNVVVMADVSGSMESPNYQPIATSIGLAIYFAQRNKGAYHNLFMNYSEEAEFIELQDSWDIQRCVREANKNPHYNTNLDNAFRNIYNVAIKAGETPKALVIISDGQFDYDCGRSFDESIVGKWNRKFREAGLSEIKVISWNVNGRDNVMATVKDDVTYCSGYGVGPFKFMTELIDKSAWDCMVAILTQPEFSWK